MKKKIPIIKVEHKCNETIPCQHTLYIDGKKTLMYGNKIEILLRKYNLTNRIIYRHFQHYKTF